MDKTHSMFITLSNTLRTTAINIKINDRNWAEDVYQIFSVYTDEELNWSKFNIYVEYVSKKKSAKT